MFSSLIFNKQKRFSIKVHNTLPFGSAIILDGDLENGRIQIETKPYNVENEDVTWETCSLRKWLNVDFYDDNF